MEITLLIMGYHGIMFLNFCGNPDLCCFCFGSYVCDDYVLNDNAAGDLKLLRSALSAVATQKFTDIESRGRHLLRSYSHTGIIRR